MRITIHQPEHMPWLGFFHKLNLADAYIVLDNVQYRRRYFQNRNKIRTNDGWQWLVVPLVKEIRDELLVADAEIFKDDLEWRENNLKRVYHNYRKAKYFKQYWNEFAGIYSHRHEFLADLNIDLIKFFLKSLGIKKEIIFASKFNVAGQKGDLIFNICKSLGAKVYVSGISGKDYLDLAKFSDNGIEVMIQEFHHPVYEQLYQPFFPCMSIIDLLFNYGDKSLDIINGKGVKVLKEVLV